MPDDDLIHWHCPQCNKPLKAARTASGRAIPCPRCRARNRVPGLAFMPAQAGVPGPSSARNSNEDRIEFAGAEPTFFHVMLDFSFSHFLTTRIVSASYSVLTVLLILGMFLSVGFGIFMGIRADNQRETIIWFASGIGGFLALIIAWILLRLWYEFLIVVFRICEHAKTIADNTTKAD